MSHTQGTMGSNSDAELYTGEGVVQMDNSMEEYRTAV